MCLHGSVRGGYFPIAMPGQFLDLDPDNQHAPARGHLLVSEPYLTDPYLRRTVVLLCEHNEEGSFGFVLNRHMDLAVNDLMENMPPIGSQVGIGGPVESGSLFYIHTLGQRIEGSQEVVDGVFMGGDYDQLIDTSWIDFVQMEARGSQGRYGGHFWLNKNGISYPDAPHDMLTMDGYQGQLVAIFPSH